jgi:AraC-like DNA-binding protein
LNRIVPLAETSLVRVSRFEHPEKAPHRDPREERADSVSLSFVLRGSFTIRAASKDFQVTPRALFATRPGLAYRTTHSESCPTDVCLSVDYRPEFFGDQAPGNGPDFPVLELTNRTAYLRWRLLRAIAQHPRGDLLDDIGVDLLAAVFRPEPEAKLFSEGSLAWYAERIEGARTLIEESFQERHSLLSLSRAAGMSPFHFARVFRSLTGTPPARYLLHVRLERARSMLRRGRPVTEVSYDCGFRNLSYFTRAFRKRYRTPPSAIRAN